MVWELCHNGLLFNLSIFVCEISALLLVVFCFVKVSYSHSKHPLNIFFSVFCVNGWHQLLVVLAWMWLASLKASNVLFLPKEESFFVEIIIKLTLCGRLRSQTSISYNGWVNSQGSHFLALLIWLMPFFQLDKNWKTFSDFIYCGWTRFFCRPAITSLPGGMISVFIPLWVCQLVGASFETWIWQFINFFFTYCVISRNRTFSLALLNFNVAMFIKPLK